jgi:sterol desaturase/sphingolipid hydroxylase (fatty acid hydroxylase superfamily)
LSRSAFFADFYAYPVASAVLIALALALEPRDWAFALGAVVVGFLLWSLVEYLLHRYVLHHIKWVKDQHDVHHRDQMALVGTPTWFSLLVFLTFVTLPMLLIASADVALGLTGGMMIGYLCYVTAHYGMHHWRIRPSSYMGGLKRRHALHHHYDDRGNFGVTSGFWDYVFRTNLRS